MKKKCNLPEDEGKLKDMNVKKKNNIGRGEMFGF